MTPDKHYSLQCVREYTRVAILANRAGVRALL